MTQQQGRDVPKVAATAAVAAVASASAPKFPLDTTHVLKRVVEDVVKDDDNDDIVEDEEGSLYSPPVFVKGHLTEYRPSQTKNEDGDKGSAQDVYGVEWEPTTTPMTTTTTTGTRRRSPCKNGNHKSSTTTTAMEQWTEDQVAQGHRLYQVIGIPVAKEFDDGVIYHGKVVNLLSSSEVDDKDGEGDGDDDNKNNDDLLYYYRILYDDGDLEDMDEMEFQAAKDLYNAQMKKTRLKNNNNKKTKKKATTTTAATTTEQQKKTKSTTKSASTSSISATKRSLEEEEEEEENKNLNQENGVAEENGTAGRRKRVRISYKEEDEEEDMDYDDEMDDVMDTDEGPKGKEKVPQKSTTRTKRKGKVSKSLPKEESDDEFDGHMMKEDASDEELEFEEEGDDEEESSMEESVVALKPTSTKKAAKKGTKKPAATAAAASQKQAGKKKAKKGDNDDVWEVYNDKLAKDIKGYTPNSNPQKFLQDGEYVDSVGIDPTHGIVEDIVAGQVRKVGDLLRKVKSSSENGNDAKQLGELTFPIKLQTACSGTDAPSIALGLIQESFDKMCPDNKFAYEHLMSCEIEPFKQGYIARNFPGVTLFPDITKLSATDQDGIPQKVVDVYGREQEIPPGNCFIAGTSCKDFSMLKTTYRKDIEDKGQSGETFLAAVEFLDLYKPPFAIFENVDGAPWDKMQEYIRGRIDLKNRNNNKSITVKDGKKISKDNADRDLVFRVNDDVRYEAVQVPPQVGMKAGDVVKGIVQEGHDAVDVKPIVPDKSNVGKTFTLGQLSKLHKIDLNEDTLVLKKNAQYCTQLVKLDTKDYGLPQTRNRKYLFIWLSDDPDDDLGEYFLEILEHLQTPLLHSFEGFLLPDTNDHIRCYREALRSGPGLLVKRQRAKELDFWDWELSQVKDLTLHKAFRLNNGIPDEMRWLTGWGPHGRKELAPGLWPELFDCWNHRRLDMVDCFSCAAIRDAVPRDPLHHSFIWDLSQNVTRAPFRSATVGVSGCVTPGGSLLVPHLGRELLGYEKLLLQGIPFSRLVLGPETQVQLSDLAGNAMSVSVISAAILGAICAPQLRRERQANKRAILADFALKLKHDSAKGAVLAERGDLFKAPRSDSLSFENAIRELGEKLAGEAFRSSVLCYCESSGTVTQDPKLLECTRCSMFLCHSCSDRYHTSSHCLAELELSDARPDPHAFERALRCEAPSILRLGAGSEGELEHGSGLESYSFQLQQVDRKKKYWQLVYGAWEDHGSGRQVAEVRIVVGRIGAQESDLGASAFIRCFSPAIRDNKPLRGKLKDAARFTYKVGGSEAGGTWETPDKVTKAVLKLAGSDPVESQRALIGLDDKAAKDLKNKKITKQFLPPFNSRNPLTHYAQNWKQWPGTITVTGDPSDRVNGVYCKMACQHSVVLSALWRREGRDSPMYLFIRPDLVRATLDVAVFSSSPSYGDGLEICELEDWIPENALIEKNHNTSARLLKWKAAPSIRVEIPPPTMTFVEQTTPFNEMVNTFTDQVSGPVLCELANIKVEVIDSLLQYNGSPPSTGFTSLDLIGKAATKNAKRLSIIATPSLLKAAAEGRLSLPFSAWHALDGISNLGKCPKNVPLRPKERWAMKGDSWERIYDAEESNEYFQKLLSRPTAFEIGVDRLKGKLSIRMNPRIAAHRAAAILGGDSSSSIQVDYRLSKLSSMGEPVTKEFRVPNSDNYDVTTFAKNEMTFPLYTRQAKALTRMLDIENGSVVFPESERSEHVLPGVGWCLIGRAQKKSPLRGGVLGDAIGSGKTVVTIALILKGVEKARSSRVAATGRSGATLIVVPPGLVRQWDDERKKFTGNKLKCIIIDSTSTLKSYSVEDLCNADIVIVPAGIIEEEQGKIRPYTDHLRKKAKSEPIPPAPKKSAHREAPTIEGTVVRNMASGPEIYVGNKGSQKDRDELAWYSHCYSEAIQKLRQQHFGPKEKGVPLEYFTWERIVIDECHETLVTGKEFKATNEFKDTARRGAREFLGVAQTDISKRPLVAATGVWGLTGTPLLETEARVTELANLMGGTYITGAAHHWRKEERESGRDMFLNQTEGIRSREYRCAVQEAAHLYVKEACQRNRGEELQVKLYRDQKAISMSEKDAEMFLEVIKRVNLKSFSISADQLGEMTPDVLSLTASSKARHAALNNTLAEILKLEPETKIIVFASSGDGYKSALEALRNSKKKFCHVSNEHDSVEKQNEIISWFRHVDATEEDRQRPRVLLLSFEQAAGHNLQMACHNVILYDPVYTGPDAVADASVEEQAVGRVFRQGQQRDVTVTRIILKGPKGERCIDDWISERNLDDNVLRAATSNFD